MDNNNNTFHYEKRSRSDSARKKKPNDLVRLCCIFATLTIFVIIPASIYVGVVIARSDSSDNTKVSVVYVEKEASDRSLTDSSPVAGVCKAVSGSIAEISAVTRTVLDGGIQERKTQKCDGIVWSKTNDDCYVITNYHNVESSTDIYVCIGENEGSGSLVAFDEKSDIALLKCNVAGATSVMVDKNALALGQSVVAVGFASTSNGIISELSGEAPGMQNAFIPMVGTNAVLENGRNGSGLFNMNGSLVGMVIYSDGSNASPMSYVLPTTDLCTIVDELITRGFVSGRVDMSFAEIQRRIDGTLFVANVTDKTCGLEVGDVIVKVNTLNILSQGDWVSALLAMNVGDKVTFTVIKKNGQEASTDYVLKEKFR